MALPILLYHRIADEGEAEMARYSVRPRTFRWQMELLRRRNWTSVGPEDVLAARRGERPLPERAVWITFDDATRDFETAALPILRRCGLTATVYAPTAWVGRTMGWLRPLGLPGADVPLLDWDGLARMREAGMTVGSHTATHPQLTQLSDPQLEEELAGSLATLRERLGGGVEHLAYPHGDLDLRVRDAAARAGYATATTTRWGLSGEEDLLELRRVYVYRRSHPIDFHLHITRGGDLAGPVRYRRDRALARLGWRRDGAKGSRA